MAQDKKSGKQLQIDKANAAIVLIVSLAAVVTAFSLVGVKSLLSQQAFQARVISQQKDTLKVADADIDALKKLSASYDAFDNASSNIIGGVSAGTGPKDGNNSKIVLDALPNQYDFPALISSMENLLTSRGFKIKTLSGIDDIALAESASQTKPVPVEIPFQVGVVGSFTSVQDLVGVFERSIRPISLQNIKISGSDDSLELSVNAKTYYQPGKNLNVTNKVIK